MQRTIPLLLAIAPVSCGAPVAAWLDSHAFTRREWAAAGLATLATSTLGCADAGAAADPVLLQQLPRPARAWMSQGKPSVHTSGAATDQAEAPDRTGW